MDNLLKELAKVTKGEFTFDVPDPVTGKVAASESDGGGGGKKGKKKGQ